MSLTAFIALAHVAAAEPARLIRCTVDLELPDGSTLVVPGWSHDEDRAAAHARTAARAAAHWHAAPSRWALLGAAPELARESLREKLHRVGVPTTSPGLPDDAIGAPVCERQLLPKAKPDAGWSATWMAGATVTRASPAMALEAARRRTCLSAWQEVPLEVLGRGTPAGAMALRHREGFERARNTLMRCLSHDPADALLPTTHVDMPASAGVVQCSRPVQGEGLFAAWGVDLEDAREALLWRTAVAASRRTWRQALPEGLDDEAVERGQAGPLHDLVIPDDRAEQAMMVCATGPRDTAATLEWAARDAQTSEACGLPTPARMEIPDPFWLTTAVDDLCRTHGTERAIATVIPEIGEPGADAGRLAALGWRRSLFCESRCWTDARVEGWSVTPVSLPDEPNRTDAAAAAMLLDAAIQERDLSTLGILTGGVMLARAYRELDATDPDALWASLSAARASSEWTQSATWVPIHGQFLLAFSGP